MKISIKPNFLLLLNSSHRNVIKIDKYNLSSPEVLFTSSIDFLFLDQQRYHSMTVIILLN